LQIDDYPELLDRICAGTNVRVVPEPSDFDREIGAVVVDVDHLQTVKVKPHRPRLHLRVDGVVHLWHRVIDKSEFEHIKHRLLGRLWERFEFDADGFGSYQSGPNLSSHALGLNPGTETMLANLDMKLTTVLNLLISQEKRDLFSRKPVQVNISEEGLRFRTSEMLEEGTLLELKMILPILPLETMQILGEVIWRRRLWDSQAETEGFEVGVKYLIVHPDHCDQILKYVFKRHREILRGPQVDGELLEKSRTTS
jgi:hypothetical protein